MEVAVAMEVADVIAHITVTPATMILVTMTPATTILVTMTPVTMISVTVTPANTIPATVIPATTASTMTTLHMTLEEMMVATVAQKQRRKGGREKYSTKNRIVALSYEVVCTVCHLIIKIKK